MIRRFSRKQCGLELFPSLGRLLFTALFLFAHGAPVLAQAIVFPVFAIPVIPGAEVDFTAVWVVPSPRDSLLFVTEKTGDRVQV